jgi:hypothetical protein
MLSSLRLPHHGTVERVPRYRFGVVVADTCRRHIEGINFCAEQAEPRGDSTEWPLRPLEQLSDTSQKREICNILRGLQGSVFSFTQIHRRTSMRRRNLCHLQGESIAELA